METTPKSMRLHIALTGRVNSGKSTLLNLLVGQEVAITSPQPGTTTDVVEKPMELRPLGPVLWLDTAGLADDTELGAVRTQRALRAVDRADVLIVVTTPGQWGNFEEQLLQLAQARKIAVIPVINKIDEQSPDAQFCADIQKRCSCAPILVSALHSSRDEVLDELKVRLVAALPDDLVKVPPLLSDLVQPGKVALFLVPLDIEAPQGRLILPQVQSIRSALDQDAIVTVVKTSQYPQVFQKLKENPAVVIGDSQAVGLLVKATPPEIPCTTFSILFARLKGDLELLARGAGAIRHLRPGDRVLIAEACTHQSCDADIGRVKIPRWLEEKVGGKLQFDVVSGRDYPADLADYNLVIHCGGCMLNRRETLHRMALAAQAGVPITNYGMAISACHGVLERVLSPLPEALTAYRQSILA